MSVLTHRCRFCGHLEDRHAARERGYQPCPCCNGARSSVDPDLDPEPELHPTYALPGHLPEPLWAPGATRNAGTSHTTRTCACERCRAVARAAEDPDEGEDSAAARSTGKLGESLPLP